MQPLPPPRIPPYRRQVIIAFAAVFVACLVVGTLALWMLGVI